MLLWKSFDLGFSKAIAEWWPVFAWWQNLTILEDWIWWNAEVVRFRQNLTTKNHQAKLEAYNWVVSICLKYVSLPWHMVNSLRRGASEPWAWREFYKAWYQKDIIHVLVLCDIFSRYHQAYQDLSHSQISDVMMCKIKGFQM